MFKKAIVITLCTLYLLTPFYSNVYAEESETDAQEISAEEISVPEAPVISSESATLMDAKTGIVLYEQAQDVENYPASVTKIMTALLTLEFSEDIKEERITFSPQSVYSLPKDASHIAMNEGETLTIYDALHGLLLSSANEVANALAEHIAGSVEDFAILMNKRAAAIGATNTHFTNPSGLFDEAHVTTAHDMALIMREATKHPEFNEIIGTRRYDIAPTEKQPEPRELLNSNRLIQPGEFFDEAVVGGKTGYTDEAMHTLVNFAEKDGRSLIVSVMHGEKDGTYADTEALLEYGFALPYTEKVIFDSADFVRTVPVFTETNTTGERIKVGDAAIKAKEDLPYALPDAFDVSEIRYDLELPSELTAPVATEKEVGKVTCYIQDIKLGEAPLLTLNSVYAPPTVADAETETPATETATAPQTETPQSATVGVMASDVKPVTEIEDELFPFSGEDYWRMLMVPAGLSLFMLLITFVAFLKRRKKKNPKVLTMGRYAKFGERNLYRYK